MTTTTKKPTTKYKVKLVTSGKQFIAEADTIDESLEKLGLVWNNIKAKGVITVTAGKDSYEHLFYITQLKRIFANKLTRAMWAKRLDLLLQAGKTTNKIEKLETKDKQDDKKKETTK